MWEIKATKRAKLNGVHLNNTPTKIIFNIKPPKNLQTENEIKQRKNWIFLLFYHL